MRDAIPHMGEIIVSAQTAEKVRQGCRPAWEELMSGWDEKTDVSPDLHDGWIKLVSGGGLVAILQDAVADGGRQDRVKIERVFSS